MGEAGEKKAAEIKAKAQAALDAGRAQTMADSAAADARYATQQVAKAAADSAQWKKPRFWLGLVTFLAGIGVSIAAAFGADPGTVADVRAVADGVTAGAEAVVAADEAGDWTQGIGGAAVAAAGLAAMFAKKRAPKQ